VRKQLGGSTSQPPAIQTLHNGVTKNVINWGDFLSPFRHLLSLPFFRLSSPSIPFSRRLRSKPF